MTANIQIFSNPQFGNIRTIELNSKIWFGATDVAKVLGYVNPKDAIIRHCKSAGVVIRDLGVKTGIKADGTPSIQNMKIKFINEGNVYRLISRSQLPSAEEFESWIFDELVPTVMKSGGYIATKESDTPEEIMSRALLIAQDTLKRREEKIAILEEQNKLQSDELKKAAPKVEYVDTVLQSVNTYTITQIAKELGFTSGESLNKKLKELGIQFYQSGQWMLTHTFSNKGYTATRTQTFTRSDGSVGTRIYTVWTEKGRAFLHKTFGG